MAVGKHFSKSTNITILQRNSNRYVQGVSRRRDITVRSREKPKKMFSRS